MSKEYLVLLTAGGLWEVFLPAHGLLLQGEVRVDAVRLRIGQLLHGHADVHVGELLHAPLLIHYVDEAANATVLTVHAVYMSHVNNEA